MTDKQWRKFGEIQYLRGRLDEMFKIDNLIDLDMSGMRRIDARIDKYLNKLKSIDEMTYELYLIERDNIQHKIRKLTKNC
jgi:hypothetical protein|tara:strand:- start:188 stop:427 length:240 start_codon:yes stop_codon:yes gene_type:complete